MFRHVGCSTAGFFNHSHLEHIDTSISLHRVAKILQIAGRNGRVVIVGRGAQYILPHEGGLFVRLIGSTKYRVSNVVRLTGKSRTDADKYVRETDETRRQFVRQYFHRDVADPLQYDLVINVERFGAENTAKQIVATYRSQELL